MVKLFEYKFTDARNRPKSIVTVFDIEKDNVVYWKYENVFWDPITHKITLSSNKLDEFKSLLSKHKKIFSLWELEYSHTICDWYISKFFICDWFNKISFNWFNLWFFDHNGYDEPAWKIVDEVNWKKVVNAKILLEFFYDIRDFLQKNWVAKYCFKY